MGVNVDRMWDREKKEWKMGSGLNEVWSEVGSAVGSELSVEVWIEWIVNGVCSVWNGECKEWEWVSV